MKNILFIDMDTERKQSPIVIGKPENARRPSNPIEGASMVLFDISTLCEALCTLIHVADQNGIEKSAVTLRRCIDHLEKGFGDASYKGLILPHNSQAPSP